MEPTALQTLARPMISAHRIFGTQRARCEHLYKMILDVARLLHQPTKCSVGVWASRVKKNTEMLADSISVDSFSNRASWVTATHGERLD